MTGLWTTHGERLDYPYSLMFRLHTQLCLDYPHGLVSRLHTHHVDSLAWVQVESGRGQVPCPAHPLSCH